MAVSLDDFAAIERALTQAAGLGQALAQLRAALPHLRWLGCEAADVEETPYRIFAELELHLLDCAGHCVRVIADPQAASGLLLARRAP